MGDDELNQEELEILLLAEQINMRLKEEDPQLRFPVREGWEALMQRYHDKTARIKRLKRYRLLAVAAVLLVVLAPAFWLFLKKETANQELSGNQIQLTLADGKIVDLDSSQSTVLQTEGLALNGNNLVYKPETALPAQGHEPDINTLSVPNGKYTRMELSDGTKVWVNAGSKLTYPVPFAANTREVTLEGEAYFDVSHNAERPFVVHVKGVDVNVLGTAFGVNTLENQVSIALQRGKVRLDAGNQSLVLLPGELGVYKGQSKSLTKSEADLRLYTAWKDLDLYFSENTLHEITSRLAREYNVSFVYEDEDLKKLHFTIDMPKQTELGKILSNIKFSSDQVDFVTKGNIIQVKKR
jgi:ferric-dicitrate binding protein FerR (iron transport regulator)